MRVIGRSFALLPFLLGCVAAEYSGNFALSFHATEGDVVRVPHESSMQGPLIDSFTVELWLKVPPNSQLDAMRVVNLVGFPGRHPFLGLAADTGCACIQLKTSNGTWYSYEGTTPIDDGEWHHVAATWDGRSATPSKRELALYVDGQLEPAGGDDDDTTRVPKRPEAGGLRVVRTCEDGLCEEGMHIGGLYCCSGGGYSGRYLNGMMDEIRVWTRARSRHEIESTMHQPLNAGDEAGLLFYFPMDEAGMETGANVIESRALPWYGILGNAKGGGRPHWSVSTAPLSCNPKNRAAVCKRIQAGLPSIASPSQSLVQGGSVYAQREGEEEDEGVSTTELLVWLFFTAAASGSFAAIMTYAHVTGLYPPVVTKLAGGTSHFLRSVLGGGDSYMPANAGSFSAAPPGMHSPPSASAMPSARDWTWAQPPRDGQQASNQPSAYQGEGGVRNEGPASAPRQNSSYGGL